MLALTGKLKNFMHVTQRTVLAEALDGEERVAIAENILQILARIEATPKTYETDNIAMKDKIVHLHYFMGGMDAWIIERDIGTVPEEQGMGAQHQAFGIITTSGESFKDSERGYISIQDLIANGVELDLHFVPTSAKEFAS